MKQPNDTKRANYKSPSRARVRDLCAGIQRAFADSLRIGPHVAEKRVWRAIARRPPRSSSSRSEN